MGNSSELQILGILVWEMMFEKNLVLWRRRRLLACEKLRSEEFIEEKGLQTDYLSKENGKTHVGNNQTTNKVIGT